MLKALLFLGFANISSFVFITACTSFLLTFHLNVEESQRATTVGYLETADQAVALVGCPLWGTLSGLVGERVVCILGLMFMAFGAFSQIFAKNSLPASFNDFWSSVLLSRMIFSAGGAASITMLTAYTSTLASSYSPTRVSSYLGISSGVGAMFAAFFLNRLPSVLMRHLGIRLSLLCSYSLMVSILVAAAVAVWMCLPERSTHNVEPKETETLRTGDAPLAAVMSGSIARINSVSPHLFVPLWVASYCRAYHPEENSFEASKRTASILLGTCQLAALLGAPIIAVFGKKIDQALVMTIVSSLGAFAYLCLSLVNVPDSIWGYLVMALVGVVEISSVIISLSYFISYFGSTRGKRSGLYGLFGSLGIIFISNLGGYVSDITSRTSPFIVVGYANLMYCLLSARTLVARN